jgi:hypothetical protein
MDNLDPVDIAEEAIEFRTQLATDYEVCHLSASPEPGSWGFCGTSL